MANVYNTQLDAFEVYHLYNERHRKPALLDGPALPAIGHALAGAAGSAISSVAVYPLDLIVTRLQIQRQHGKSAVAGTSEQYHSIRDAFEKIYSREGGWKALYAGVQEDTAKSIADAFLFFLSYNFLRQVRQRRLKEGASHLSAIEELSVGFAAGAFSKLLTTPIANVVTRLQTSSMTAPGQRKQTARDVARQIRSEKGLIGLWSGYSATLVLTLNPSLTFFFFETLKRLSLPQRLREHPTPVATFFLAAVSKALASTITYPFSLAKARSQASSQSPSSSSLSTEGKKPEGRTLGDGSGNDSSASHAKAAAARARQSTVFATILHIARTEGVGALYEGLAGEVLKGFFSHGTTMLVKEGVHALVIRTYYAVLKLLRRYPSPQALAERAKAQTAEAAQTVTHNVTHQAANAVETAKASAGGIQRFGDESAAIAKDQAAEVLAQARSGAQKANETVVDGVKNLVDRADKAVKNVKGSVGR